MNTTALTTWPAHDAERHFGELMDACLAEGPQLVRRGGEAVVMVPEAEWRRLQRPRTVAEWLDTDDARGDLVIPPRGRFKRPAPPAF